MKTIIKDFTKPEVEAKKPMPIILIECLRNDYKWEKVSTNELPSLWQGIALVSRKYGKDDMDLILCWDGDISNPDNQGLYTGYWNDGFIESI